MASETGHQANRVYLDQSGNLHLNGASLFDGSEVDQKTGLSSATLEANSATLTPAAGAANQSLVTIQLLDNNGNNVAYACVLEVWLSDAATGAGETATTASGAVGAGASGVDLLTITSKKRLRVKTSTAGAYVLAITDSSKTGFYVVAQLPSGVLAVSAQLVTGNYG